MNIEVGNIFKGNINGELFEIIKIDEDKDEITLKNKNKLIYYGLGAFKRCQLTQMN